MTRPVIVGSRQWKMVIRGTVPPEVTMPDAAIAAAIHQQVSISTALLGQVEGIEVTLEPAGVTKLHQ